MKRYHKHLRDRGLSDRTIANRFTSLLTFLRYAKIDVNEMLPKSTRRKLTRYTEKKVEIYTPDEINKLIAASNEYHALVWYFLHKTGFRMQEAMYLEWDDVDFSHNTVGVRSKPE